MSSVQALREFVTERLTAAAEEILGVFVKTLLEYEEEIERQRRLLDLVWKPEIRLHRIELPQQHICKEEEVLTNQQLCNKERNSSLDQVDPESSQIKGEREELCSSQEEEQLLVKQETETFHQLLSDSSPVAESQDQEGSKHVDSRSSRNTALKPKKTCHINTSDKNNIDNTLMSGTLCDTHTELPQQHVCKEEEVLTDQQLCNKERNSRLDQDDPEPPQIKEEQEELCSSQEGVQLVLKQETDTSVLIPTDEENDHQLLSHSSPAPESQDQKGSQHTDSESTRTLELKPNRQHLNTSHSNNIDNSPMSETHCDTHRGKRAFTCGTCGKMFKYKSTFDIHLRIHTGEKPYVCNTCGKRFTQLSALNVHLKIHTNERSYSCKICRNTFIFSNDLLAHMRTHSCEKVYSCMACGKTFKNSRDLRVHMKTHKGENPYSCNTCGKRFSGTKLLKSHMKVHTGVKAYVCETCGKCFTFSSNLLVHLRTHTGEKPYSCETCGKGFTCSGDLKGHMRTHTGEKPYACNTCGKRFGESTSLKRHSRTHTGERPYSCDICGRSFTHNSSLLAHMRIHTGEKPYSCETCGKGFTISSTLMFHRRTHTGEKPYACNTCGKRYYRMPDLRRHIKIHTVEST